MEFYNKHRPHQGIDSNLIDSTDFYCKSDPKISEGSFLGGHLNYYYRDSA